jgi:hypothetical protein
VGNIVTHSHLSEGEQVHIFNIAVLLNASVPGAWVLFGWRVALKFLSEELGRNELALERFKQQARTAFP